MSTQFVPERIWPEDVTAAYLDEDGNTIYLYNDGCVGTHSYSGSCTATKTSDTTNSTEEKIMTNIYPSNILIVEHGTITRTFQPLTATYPASIVATQGTAITTRRLHTA